MKKKAFRFPMRKGEAIFGWIYAILHIFLLGWLLSKLNEDIFPLMGFTLSESKLNLLYFITGFILIFLCMFRYMKSSFGDLWENKLDSFTSILLGFAIYILSMYAVGLLIGLLGKDAINPNTAAIIYQTKLNPNVMLVIGVLFAPIVEETLFRGVIFGTVRKSSRFWGYAVSAILFAVYHLFDYILGGLFAGAFDWTFLLYLLQYIPAAIILCWCYERSRNIWAPVFLHMIINYVSISINIG